jgi:hypothetical protein
MPFLGLIDLSGIQDYIYRHKDLKDIAAASRTIEKFSAANGLFARSCTPGTELIFMAGGNAAFRANERDAIRETMRTISRELLVSHRGLQPIAVVHPYEAGTLAADYSKASVKLDVAKQTQRRSVESDFSGLVWTGAVAPARPVSADPHGYCEPLDFTKLICHSNTDQTNLMGVVSIDGIGMGSRLIGWLRGAEESGLSDDRFVSEFAVWSAYLKQRWDAAWGHARASLRTAFGAEWALTDALDATRTLRMRLHEKQPCYPVRRIYQGGDDLLFVSPTSAV